jgi:hypothetical protein
MGKKAVSLTLAESNLLWLQSITNRGGARSVSEAVDRLVTEARARDATGGVAPRSVVGTVAIDDDDAQLEKADTAMRDLFERSLRRPLVVREDVEPFGKSRKRAKRG